jgi:hypothetical protein
MIEEGGGERISEESFPLVFNCELSAVEHGGEVTIVCRIEAEKEPPGALRMIGGNVMHYIVPTSIFRDRDARAEYLDSTLRRFKHHLAGWLMQEAGLLLMDTGNYYLDSMGIDPEPTTKKELVKIHLNETEKRVANYLGVKGQRAKWTTAELERAVANARRSLKKPNATLDEVADVLRRTHPQKAPASGEALGVMLRRHRIKWKGIKTDS